MRDRRPAVSTVIRLRRRRQLSVVLLCVALAACERESRPFRELSVAASRTQTAPMTDLHAGGPVADSGASHPFQHNAYGISEGKRLFDAYNCSGCHAHGGGGMGPPLMDDQWIYGSRPANIFATIVEGRPNGMPSFRNTIPDLQVWQLAAYVESMSGQEPIDVLPGRSDHMQSGTAENLRPAQVPVQVGRP